MDDYTRRRLAAMRREQLGIISQADREIVGIYQRAQEEMARQARDARSGSLTERWLQSYSHSLDETVGQMRRDIYGTVKDAATRAAQLPADHTERFLATSMERAGADASFRGVLSKAPTDAIRSIIDGRMYRDGVTLSRRIWNQTGWLQHGVEDVITQGLAQQQDLKSIARALEQYMDPGEKAPIDIRRLYPSMGEPAKGGQPIPATYQIEYNSLRLARTAVNHAYWGASKASAKLNPLCEGMRWILSDEHFTRQVSKWGPDVCDEYAAHDEGLGVGVYPVDKMPLPHPQCLCRQEQVVPTIDEAADRLRAWMDGASDPALDQGFALAQKRRALDNPPKFGTIKLPDQEIFRGPGAKGANYDILGPDDQYYQYAAGTKIQDREVFAGYGTRHPLHEGVAEGLTEEFGGDPTKWRHEKGIGIIDRNGEEVRAEVHWFYAESVGQVKHMIKEWLE